jgi:hypothetical protein
MNNLKKSISLILFQKQLYKNPFVLILPTLAIRLSPSSLKLTHGVKFLFLKNKRLSLNISNISYLCLPSKQLLYKTILQYKKTFLGYKFNNLYFSAKVLDNFNYLKYFNLTFFLLNLKKIYFYFLKYLFALKNKIIINN